MTRDLPTETYYLRVADDTAARAELKRARDRHELANFRGDSGAAEAIAKAEAAIDAAQAAVDACYEPIVLRALLPQQFEDMVKEHPPRSGKDERYNTDTFPMALFTACVQGDMSAEEWAAFLAERCSIGERNGLLVMAQNLNARVPDGTIPKD